MNTKIRRIQHSDLDRCVAIIKESFATVASEFGLTEQNCPGHTTFIKIEKLQDDFTNDCPMFGYFIDDNTVGFVELVKKSDTAFELEKLAVLPQYRHYGYGKELMDYCKEKIKELGGKKITIGIIEENTRLKAWYTIYGFAHIGKKKFDHLPFTVGFMEMNLD